MANVSVIMGIYNCADTLGAAIDSLLAQTFTDWNLVMCDDGSRDATYEVAERYRRTYPERITLLKNEQNMGLNYTLNRCGGSQSCRRRAELSLAAVAGSEWLRCLINHLSSTRQ